jgi:large subunit ribosomal protein L7/L12
MTVSKEDVIEYLKSISVIELSDLIKELETTFGVSAAAPVAVAAVGAVAEVAAPVEEQTEFSVIMTASGDSKVNVYKEVRTITSLALKDVKEAVDNLPLTVKEGITKEEANKFKAQLEAVGATVEIK